VQARRVTVKRSSRSLLSRLRAALGLIVSSQFHAGHAVLSSFFRRSLGPGTPQTPGCLGPLFSSGKWSSTSAACGPSTTLVLTPVSLALLLCKALGPVEHDQDRRPGQYSNPRSTQIGQEFSWYQMGLFSVAPGHKPGNTVLLRLFIDLARRQ